MRNIVHTLAYNLVSETEKALENLYRLNDRKDFEHYLVDLDYPTELTDVIPDDIGEAKKRNTEKLKALAAKYGST